MSIQIEPDMMPCEDCGDDHPMSGPLTAGLALCAACARTPERVADDARWRARSAEQRDDLIFWAGVYGVGQGLADAIRGGRDVGGGVVA